MIRVDHDPGTIISIPYGQHRIDALHYHVDPQESARAGHTVILRLHGLLGNLLDETEHFLPVDLARRGYASISMNTLLANLGLFYGFGVFDQVIPQIDAVFEFLRAQGHRRIVIAGHGVGGCMAIRYAAMRNDAAKWPELCGVIAIATPYSLPDTIRRRWQRFGSEPTYDELCRKAAERVGRPEGGSDETILIRRAHGPTRRPEHSEVYTLKTWWHLAGPEASGTKSFLHVGKIKVPLLVIDALRDEVLEAQSDEDVARVAASEGHRAVTHVQLDATHAFDGRHAELGDTIASWLKDRTPPAGGTAAGRGGSTTEEQALLRFRADDGFLLTALLVTQNYRDFEEIRDVPLLLQIHGSLGHFLARGTPRLLPHELVKRGYSSLSINTRLANAGQMTGRGIFHDTVKDIDAAVRVLEERGFRNIFILGYSLGASMLVHWASQRDHSNIRGLILEGCLYSTATSQKKRFERWQAEPSYEAVYERAKAILGPDPSHSAHDETFVVYQSKGSNHEPINDEIFTYKTWWFMEGPEAHAAMAHQHIGKITVPVLMMRGEHDFMVEPWELPALAGILEKSGNPNVRAVEVPGAGHDCMENSEVMVEEIVKMLENWSYGGRI